MLRSVWEDVENTGFHDPLFHELTSAGHHHVSDASQLLACGIGVAGFSPMFNAFKHYPQSEHSIHSNPLTTSILTMVELVRYSFWALLPESSSLTKPRKPKIVIRIVTVRRIGRLSHTKRERINVLKAIERSTAGGNNAVLLSWNVPIHASSSTPPRTCATVVLRQRGVPKTN